MPTTVPRQPAGSRVRDLLLLGVILVVIAQNGLPALRALADKGNSSQPAATALEEAFTYQGRLVQDGIAQDGNFDFEFNLFDVATGGTPIVTLPPLTNVPVANGLFTV